MQHRRNKSIWRLTLLATTAAIVVTGGAPRASAQAGAQAAAADNGLEEIVVTARRREERLQTVPVAITAFSQTDLEKQRIQQVTDLSKAVPSLSVSISQSDVNEVYSSQVRLRGLPGSTVYFAEVPIGNVDYNPTTGISHGLAPGFYYDLDHLEVDKGPQGTLFGKNSIGGLISLEPKRPVDQFEGYGQVTFGNYGDKEVEGAINIPVVPGKLLVRVAGQMQQRDGYTKDATTGVDYDNRDYYAWRVGVTLRPSDDLENYFLYDGYWQDSNGSSSILSYLNPGFTSAFGTVAGLPLTLGHGPGVAGLSSPDPAVVGATFAAGLQAGAFSIVPNVLEQLLAAQKGLGVRAVTGRSVQGIGKDYFYGFTNVTTWDVNDDLTVKNIAAARIFKQLTTADDFGAPVAILNVGAPGNNQQWGDNSIQYTEELQLQGKALNEKLSWVLGGYLEFDHPLGHTLLASTAIFNTSYYHFYNSERSQAAFIHGIYDLSDYVDGLRFTAGYRYTWDYVSVQEQGFNGVDGPTRVNGGPATNCAPIGFDQNCSSNSSTHFSSFGWNLGLDEQLTPSTMVYVRSGNAYRPGGTNPQVPLEFQSLKPEHVTDVELGIKTDWELMGVHGRTNFDIFHTDYKAIQVQKLVSVTDAQGNTHEASLEQNAASASLEGGELEATIVPIEGLEISPHASYLYSHYDEYPTVFGASEVPPFFYEPKWQYGVNTTYHLPIDESIGDVAIGVNYSWAGHQYVGLSNEIYNIIPSYDNLDLRVDWTNIFGSTFDTAFFMTNVTDNTHVTGAFPIYATLGFTSLVYNAPRMFGFSLKYRFGPSNEPDEAAAPAAPAPAPAAAVPSIPRSYLVFFDFDKSDLTPEGSSIVDKAAANAKTQAVTRIDVTGHTDTVGSDAYNMRLSKRRAESVAAALEAKGIGADEIAIFAKGKRDPLVPTGDGVKEPQNRRVEIVYAGGASS